MREVPWESKRELSAEDQNISISTAGPKSAILILIKTKSSFEGVAIKTIDEEVGMGSLAIKT